MLPPRSGSARSLEHPQLLGDRLFALVFQDFQQKREFGHLHRLRVDVHTEDVVEQYSLLLRRRHQPPVAARPLVEDILACFSTPSSSYQSSVPIEEPPVGPDEERPGAARGVEDSKLRLPAWASLPSKQLPDGVLDDVVHDVGGRVVDPARLLYLGLVLDLGLMAGREADDLAQKLLVDLA